MDLIVQMLPASLRRYSTHMDYVGQQKAERIMQVIVVLSGVIGFLVGFWFERISYMVLTVLGGTVLAALVVLPPWPCFRKNPLPWKPALDKEKEKKDN